MTCSRAVRSISARLDGALDDDGRRRLDSHLASCGACRTRDAELGRVRGLLRSVEPLDDVPGRAWNVASAVLEEARRPAPPPSRKRALAIASCVAAAALTGALAFATWGGEPHPESQRPVVQAGRFQVTLDEPDPELFDRLSRRFRTLGAVEETRAERSFEVRYRFEVTAEAEARHDALRDYLRGFSVVNGSWSWSLDRE